MVLPAVQWKIDELLSKNRRIFGLFACGIKRKSRSLWPWLCQCITALIVQLRVSFLVKLHYRNHHHKAIVLKLSTPQEEIVFGMFMVISIRKTNEIKLSFLVIEMRVCG